MAEEMGIQTFMSSLEDGGVDGVPPIEEWPFVRLLAGWRVVGQGNRPVDHIGRDLLYGSLGRDYRVGQYHRLRREPPEWVADAYRRALKRGVEIPRGSYR